MWLLEIVPVVQIKNGGVSGGGGIPEQFKQQPIQLIEFKQQPK